MSQVWARSKWPCGSGDGVFAQLETKAGLKKLWFVPVQGKEPG